MLLVLSGNLLLLRNKKNRTVKEWVTEEKRSSGNKEENRQMPRKRTFP